MVALVIRYKSKITEFDLTVFVLLLRVIRILIVKDWKLNIKFFCDIS